MSGAVLYSLPDSFHSARCRTAVELRFAVLESLLRAAGSGGRRRQDMHRA